MTADQIQKFCTDFGFKPSTTKAEVKKLHEILNQDETLTSIIEGNLKYAHDKKEVGFGVLLTTNKRALFFRKSLIGTVTTEEFPLNKISSCSLKKGIIQSSIILKTSGTEVEINYLNKKEADKVNSVISDLINKASHQIIVQPANISVSDELKKLAELKEQNILTQEEFDDQKKKLLNI